MWHSTKSKATEGNSRAWLKTRIITILACASASGYALPPFVVFDRKTLNQELTKGEVPGTVYGLSASQDGHRIIPEVVFAAFS